MASGSIERVLLSADQIARRVDVWRVLSYRRKGDEPTASSAPTPGIKYVSFVMRADGLAHEQFVRHWSERHTTLALEHHVGMTGYVQRVVRRAYTPGGRTIDGIAELTFASRADLDERFYDSDEGKRIIGDDVVRFIQRVPGSPTLMTEHVLR